MKMDKLLKRILNKETILYIIFGVLTTVVDFIVAYLLFYKSDFSAVSSNTIAWVVAVIFAYITNKIFVFEAKQTNLKVLCGEIVAFVGARLVTLIMTNIFILITSIIGIEFIISKLLISVFVIIINYFFSKLFVFKKENERAWYQELDKKFLHWFKNNLNCILGFLVPMIVLGGIFIGKEIIPWGENMYLRSDMYHQYAPFYKELYNKLVSGGSLEFSWNIGMGVNFTAIYAYYLASPINLLLGILPEGYILHAMDFLIILKTSLAGLTCAYYLSKRFNNRTVAAGAVSVFYALSSYMAAFSWNIMWLDCIMLLPLILLGLESLVKKGKYKLYTITLGIAIFTNYYIAIMICIFAVLYFFVLLFTDSQKRPKRFKLKKMISFGFFSLIAGGIGAVMIIPELYALGYTVSGDFSFPELWSNYFSILDMFSRSLISVPVSIFSAHDPNIYCTVAVFIMIPLYCMCSKIPLKERVGKMILVIIFLISFNTNIPNYIWHGFHFPNSLPARESFIYIFLLITMGYEAMIHIRDFTRKQLFGAFAGAVCVVLLIEELYVSSDYLFDVIYISLAFLAFYMILIMAYEGKKIKTNFIIYLLFVVCIAEATINSDHEESYKITSYASYVQDNEVIEDLVESVSKDENDFFRIEKLTRKTKNDAAWNNYKGVSIFSSMTNGSFTNYLGALGFEKSTNAYSYYGYTPFSSALLSVKYVFSNSYMENNEYYTLVDFNETERRYLYELKYCLPLGFIVPEDFNNLWEMNGNNPFALQNSFAELTTGYKDMFSYISAASDGPATTFTLEEDSDIYVYTTTYVEQISYTATNADGVTVSSDTFSGLKHRQICHFGEFPAGTQIKVTTSDNDVSSLQLYAYNFNKDIFDDAYNELNSQALDITEYSDTSVKGTVNAKEDGNLYLSIVYDKGWSAYVDGEKVKISSLKGALLTIPVPAGEHTVELKYSSEGLGVGSFLTIFSILIFALFIICEKNIIKFKKVIPKQLLDTYYWVFPKTKLNDSKIMKDIKENNENYIEEVIEPKSKIEK